MDKVTILTASRVEPARLAPHSTSSIINRLGPTVALAVRFQNILGSLSVFLCWKAYFWTSISVTALWYATRFLAFYAFIATRFTAFHGFIISSKLAVNMWDSRTVQMLRRKLFYEFAVFILGSGNPVILLLFWPGWMVVAAALWMASRASG